MAWRYLKPNKSTRTPSQIITFDTESYQFSPQGRPNRKRHTLRCGCAMFSRIEAGRYTRNDMLEFTCVDKFWQWVVSKLDKRRGTWLLAHNMAFDFTLVDGWRQIEDGLFTLGIAILEDPPTIMELNHVRGKLWIVDTVNYWRCSLAELASAGDMPKLSMPNGRGSNEEWRDYCRRDAQILHGAVLSLARFITDNNLGVMKKTAASQAFQAFRHIGPDNPICFHDDKEVRQLELDSYHGGECRCDYVGEVLPSELLLVRKYNDRYQCDQRSEVGPVYVVDCNSLLPSAMREHKYPCRLLGKMDGCSVHSLGRLLDAFAVVADVLLCTQQETYPKGHRGYLAYPHGRYWTTLTTPDLIRAFESDHIQAVGRVAYYQQEPLFGRYVDKMYALRMRYKREGNVAYEQLCKLLLNSLYGRFGMRRQFWCDTDVVEDATRSGWGPFVYDDGTTTLWCRSINGKVQIKGKDNEHGQSFPAIAAHITAYGREHMRIARNIAGARSVYYQGEDSLHCTQAGYARLNDACYVSDDAMGKYKLVGVYVSAQYRWRYNYTIGGNDKIAGIGPNDRRIGDGKVVQTQFQRMGGIVSSRPQPCIYTTEVVLPAPHAEIHGTIGADGWVIPKMLQLGEPSKINGATERMPWQEWRKITTEEV